MFDKKWVNFWFISLKVLTNIVSSIAEQAAQASYFIVKGAALGAE